MRKIKAMKSQILESHATKGTEGGGGGGDSTKEGLMGVSDDLALNMFVSFGTDSLGTEAFSSFTARRSSCPKRLSSP